MSIHGFMDQNGQIQKYDYTDLENKPTIPAEVLIDDTLTEEGQAADAKAVGDALDNIMIPVDSTLTQQGAAADAKAVGDALQNSGLSQAAKNALLAIFQHVAYVDEYGQEYYDDLEEALNGGQSYTITYNLTGCASSNTSTSIIEGRTYFATITADSGYTLDGATATATMGGQTVTGFYNNGTISIPNVTGDLVITVTASSSVTSISAVFTQGSATIYESDSLDTLRQYLVVTATYADSSTAVVSNYTLSGTLVVGTSTITVSYGGKTTTFNVTATYGFLAYIGFFIGSSGEVYNNSFYLGGYDMKRAILYCSEAYNNITAIAIRASHRTDLESAGWVDPKYTPPIPNGVTKISVHLEGDLCCAIPVIKCQDNIVTSISSGSWSESGGVTDYDLSTFVMNGATHFAVLFRNSSNTSLENYTIDSSTVQISLS